MILEVGELLPDSLERGLRILKGGQVNVPLVWLPAWAGFDSGLRSGCSTQVGGGCGRRWLRDGGVAQRLFRSGLYQFNIRPQFVNDLVFRNCYGVLLCLVDAPIPLVEVKNVGGERRGFLLAF